MARVAPSSAPASSSSVFTFSSANPDKLFYSDGASADLVVFEYNVNTGTTNGQLRSILLINKNAYILMSLSLVLLLGRYNVSTALSPMGLFPPLEEPSPSPTLLPTAMTVARKQLWVAFKGGQGGSKVLKFVYRRYTRLSHEKKEREMHDCMTAMHKNDFHEIFLQ